MGWGAVHTIDYFTKVMPYFNYIKCLYHIKYYISLTSYKLRLEHGQIPSFWKGDFRYVAFEKGMLLFCKFIHLVMVKDLSKRICRRVSKKSNK